MSSSSAFSVLAGAVALVAAAALAACSSAPIESSDDSAAQAPQGTPSEASATLSSFFTIHGGATPLGGEGVIAYDVQNPLFSDHAKKSRVIKLPKGQSMRYAAQGPFELPIGTVVAKSFGYANAAGGTKWIETRVLVHEASGWKGYEFVWNETQTDAVRKSMGASLELRDVHGIAPASYSLPTETDCAECHGRERTAPIGLRAEQLNREDQLAQWIAKGIVVGAPAAAEIPRTPAWNDPSSGTVGERARAYLDANCAHCHREGGTAKGTGLFLGLGVTEPSKLGACKETKVSPTATYDIVPGRPEESLLVQRMRATDEAMRMPPVGRTLVHDDAVSVIESWIRDMPGACATK